MPVARGLSAVIAKINTNIAKSPGLLRPRKNCIICLLYFLVPIFSRGVVYPYIGSFLPSIL